MRVIFHKRFKKSVKNIATNNNKLKIKIEDCIEDVIKNLFKSKYYRKPLKWLKNIHELQIGGDIRIIIEISLIEWELIFLNIGTYSSLELTSTKKTKI